MYTLIIFTILCLIEFAYIAYKWSLINEMKENAMQLAEVGQALGVHKVKLLQSKIVQATASRGQRFGMKIAMFMLRFKKLLLIPIFILLLINLVVSFIFGIFVSLLV